MVAETAVVGAETTAEEVATTAEAMVSILPNYPISIHLQFH